MALEKCKKECDIVMEITQVPDGFRLKLSAICQLILTGLPETLLQMPMFTDL